MKITGKQMTEITSALVGLWFITLLAIMSFKAGQWSQMVRNHEEVIVSPLP